MLLVKTECDSSRCLQRTGVFSHGMIKLILITIGIALGFIIIDVIEKIIRIYLVKKSGIRD